MAPPLQRVSDAMTHEVERSAPSDRRLRFRFVLGAVSLGGERFTARLRDWSAQTHQVATVAPAGDRHRTRHRLLGALVARSDGAGRGVRALDEERASRGDVDDHADRTRRIARPAKRLRRRAERLRARVQRRLNHWERLGREEETKGRALAQTGFVQMTTRVLEWLSDQPAVRQLVADQSVDLTRTALDEIREVAQEADDRAESVVQRLLHRRSPPRLLPPTEE